MSMKAFRWAKAQVGLPSPEKFVLVMIADHFDDRNEHRSWPSINTLAEETGLSRSTVQRAIRALEARGLLEVEPWKNATTGVNLSNRYCLPLVDKKSIRAPITPVRVDAGFGRSGEYEYERVPGSDLVRRTAKKPFEPSGQVVSGQSDPSVSVKPRWYQPDTTDGRTQDQGWYQPDTTVVSQ